MVNCDMNKAHKKFKKINVDELTSQYIHYVSKAVNKPISTLLSELFAEIIGTCLQFEEGCNISYLREYDDVRLRFSGCSRNKVGHFKVPASMSNEDADKLLEKEVLSKIYRET